MGKDNVQFELRFYPEDGVVFYEGEVGDCFYEITQGSVYVFKKYRQLGQRLLAQLFPGDYFGELAILVDAPRNATIVAAQDNTMLRLIRDKNFPDYAMQNPDKALKILHSLGKSYKTLSTKYEDATKLIYDSIECKNNKKKEPDELVEAKKKIAEEYKARHANDTVEENN